FFGFAVWTQYKPISALMWSFIFGIIVSNIVKIPDSIQTGLKFTSGQLLKFTIALLGLVTSASVWLEVGIGAVNALVIIAFSFLASITLGRRLGLSNKLAILIGVGTSICGASAIAATAPAIQAKEEEIGIAISGITLFGLISMFLYPYLFTNTVVNQWLLGNPNVYAIWVGSGVHESAQVIAAACTLSLDCMQPALIIKSIRIFMIAPIVLASTFFLNRFEAGEGNLKAKVTVPLFAVVFLVNSLICAGLDAYAAGIPVVGVSWLWLQATLKSSLIPFLLAISFAGVGSKVKFRDIAKVGAKSFAFAAIMSIMAGVLALGMAVIIAPYVA
ncbi:putative sulfate exporter family transporter, partial [Candidatus Bathyarchaeota archaeon]